MRGGKRPNVPPSIFNGVLKSCLKQESVCKSTASLSDVQIQNQETREQDADCFKYFDDFDEKVLTQIDGFNFIKKENEVCIFMTDVIGSEVILLFKFSKVQLSFGFLHP